MKNRKEETNKEVFYLQHWPDNLTTKSRTPDKHLINSKISRNKTTNYIKLDSTNTNKIFH